MGILLEEAASFHLNLARELPQGRGRSIPESDFVLFIQPNSDEHQLLRGNGSHDTHIHACAWLVPPENLRARQRCALSRAGRAATVVRKG